MKKLIIMLVSIYIVAGMSSPAQSSQVTAKKYSSCADMLKKYPNGVAKNIKARNKAVKSGLSAPKVSKKVYKKTIIDSTKTITE